MKQLYIFPSLFLGVIYCCRINIFKAKIRLDLQIKSSDLMVGMLDACNLSLAASTVDVVA